MAMTGAMLGRGGGENKWKNTLVQRDRLKGVGR